VIKKKKKEREMTVDKFLIGFFLIIFFLGGMSVFVHWGMKTTSYAVGHESEKELHVFAQDFFDDELTITVSIVSWVKGKEFISRKDIEFETRGESGFSFQTWQSRYKRGDIPRGSWTMGEENQSYSLTNHHAHRIEATRLSDGLHEFVKIPSISPLWHYCSLGYDVVLQAEGFKLVEHVENYTE